MGKTDCNEWMCLQSSWQSGSCVGLCEQWRTLRWAAPVGCFQNLQLTEEIGCRWRNNKDARRMEVWSGSTQTCQCLADERLSQSLLIIIIQTMQIFGQVSIHFGLVPRGNCRGYFSFGFCLKV